MPALVKIPGFVEALWVGPYEAELSERVVGDTFIPRQILTPGETTALVPAGEAAESEHWQPAKPAKGAKETAE